MMNPPMQQQQQVSTVPPQQLPRGVESVYVTYNYYGRPRIMLTLDQNARRKLMIFAVILLVCGPLIVALTSACLALGHYYLAYAYAAGVLSIVTGSLAVWGSKSNNPCAIRAVMALSIQCLIWSIILTVVATVIAAVVPESRTVATIVLEVVLALLGLTVAFLSLLVTVFFCKVSCRTQYNCAPVMHPCGQQVIVCPQQQQVFGAPTGPPAYDTAHQYPSSNQAAKEQQQQYPPASLPPAYDNVAADKA